MLSLLTAALSFGDYTIIGGVVLTLLGIVSKQFQFNNKLISMQSQQREDDLDKIGATLIIVQEQGKVTADACKQVAEVCKSISETQRKQQKDIEDIRQSLALQAQGESHHASQDPRQLRLPGS